MLERSSLRSLARSSLHHHAMQHRTALECSPVFGTPLILKPARVYTVAHCTALKALPLVLDGLGMVDDEATVLHGLTSLAARHPGLKHEALAARAVRQHEKLLWALPALEADEALQELIGSGFCHGAVLVARVQRQLGEKVAEKRIIKAFRKAVDDLKASRIDRAHLERATLEWLKKTNEALLCP